MKLISALTLTALLGASAAFAGNNSASSSTGSSAAPASTAAQSETKAMSSKACNKQADEKKLTGDARATYVKDCRAGKEPK